MATKVIVNLPGGEGYPVRIGPGVMAALGRNLRETERLAQVRDLLVLTDENVAPLYLDRVLAVLSQAGFKAAHITVPAGESSKSIEVVAEIWSAMSQLGLGRDCAVVALGGGVVGDLAGFTAACYLRGVPVVQVPTTLLAMVDSSVGGKTGVNLPEGKNLVGAFLQPTFVCADTETLASLPSREWLCGCGEIAKSAVIDSDDFFFWLMEHARDLAGRSNEELIAEAIARCVVFKADIVAQDVEERAGVRECLNYGHTLGHAIELCTGFGTFSHGACVAEGMRFAAFASKAVFADEGGAVSDFTQAQADLLDSLGLAPLDFEVLPEELLAAMKRDKKARGGTLRFVLASDVARWRVVSFDDDETVALLRQWAAQRI